MKIKEWWVKERANDKVLKAYAPWEYQRLLMSMYLLAPLSVAFLLVGTVWPDSQFYDVLLVPMMFVLGISWGYADMFGKKREEAQKAGVSQ
jgi:hypothetical protein